MIYNIENRKQPNCPVIGYWLNKCGHINIMDCYKVIKNMFMSIFNILMKYLFNNDKQNNEDAKLYSFSLNSVAERSENTLEEICWSGRPFVLCLRMMFCFVL